MNPHNVRLDRYRFGLALFLLLYGFVSPGAAAIHIWSNFEASYELQGSYGFGYGISGLAPDSGTGTPTVYLNHLAVEAYSYDFGDRLWTYLESSPTSALPNAIRSIVPPLAVAQDGSALYRCGTYGYLEQIDPAGPAQVARAVPPDGHACWGPVAIDSDSHSRVPTQVYAVFEPGILVALDPSGLAERWRKTLGDLTGGGVPVVPGPTLAVSRHGLVSIAAADRVSTYTPEGQLVWATALPGASQVSVLPSDDLLVTTLDGALVTLALLDGAIVNTLPLGPGYAIYQPASLGTDASGANIAAVTAVDLFSTTAEVRVVNLDTATVYPWTGEIYTTHAASSYAAYAPPPAITAEGRVVYTETTRAVERDAVTGVLLGTLPLVHDGEAQSTYNYPYIHPALAPDGAIFFGASYAGLPYMNRVDTQPQPASDTPWAQYAGPSIARDGQDPYTTRLMVRGTVRGLEVDGGCMPLSGATIEFQGAAPASPAHTETSDADGGFAVYALPHSSYTITVSAPLRIPETYELNAAPGSTVELPDFNLCYQPGHLEVLTQDNAATPLGGVSLVLTDVASGTTLGTATTGDDGTFTFPLLDPYVAPYGVLARLPPAYLEATATSPIAPAQTTQLVLTLPAAPGQLSGMVTSAAATALSGVTIQLFQDEVAGPATATSEDGAYSVSDLVAGDYRLTYTLAGYASPGPVHVTVSAGLNTEVPVVTLTEIPPAVGSLSGRVISSTGVGIGGVLVTVLGDAGEASTTTGEDGSFVFADLFVGDYETTFVLAGYESPAPVPATVLEGEGTALVPVTMDPAQSGLGSVLATIEDGTGTALASVLVGLFGPDPVLLSSGLTDAAGTVALTEIPPGYHTLVVMDYSDGMATTSVTVLAGVVATATITLTPDTAESPQTAHLTGVVRDRTTNDTVAGVEITLMPEPYEPTMPLPPTAVTNAQGAFQVDDLVPWNYIVYAAKDGYTQDTMPEVTLLPTGADQPATQAVQILLPPDAAAGSGGGGGGGGGGGCFLHILR